MVPALEEIFADHTCSDGLGAVEEAAELNATAKEVSDHWSEVDHVSNGLAVAVGPQHMGPHYIGSRKEEPEAVA